MIVKCNYFSERLLLLPANGLDEITENPATDNLDGTLESSNFEYLYIITLQIHIKLFSENNNYVLVSQN